MLLVFVALGPGALTMTLFSYSVPRLGASSFAILANAELVTVVLIGTLLLGEAVTLGRAIGGALIVAGILTHALSRQAAPGEAIRAPSPLQRPVLTPGNTPAPGPSRSREGFCDRFSAK
jgi:drug/metabolite transporter (DMT)-like permease